MKEQLKKFWLWLSVSSADPKKFALTLKGASGVVLSLLALAGLNVSEGDANQLAEAVAEALASAVALWSTGVFIFGLLRKIWLSVRK